MRLQPKFNDPGKPVVSVLIFDHNNEKYLRECFESILNQTYSNIEINFSDNASTDDSWKIAVEYADKYKGIITITRNRQNFGEVANFNNTLMNARGKYFVQLNAEDALMPNYIAECVDTLELNQNAGFAMVHRIVIDENGNRIQEPPFYSQSGYIPGSAIAEAYLLYDMNTSISQIMYNKKMIFGKRILGSRVSHEYATKILNYNIACEFPIAYLNEPLVYHRLTKRNGYINQSMNLLNIIVPYVLQHQFVETATRFDLKHFTDFLPVSLQNLADKSLEYCVSYLLANDETNAAKYFNLSVAISPDIMQNSTFNKLKKYWEVSENEKHILLTDITGSIKDKKRKYNINLPCGSIPLELSLKNNKVI